MARRPDVEHVIAQVAAFRGRRLKLRYREVARNHAWLKRRTAALNLRNLAGKGPARRDGPQERSRTGSTRTSRKGPIQQAPRGATAR